MTVGIWNYIIENSECDIQSFLGSKVSWSSDLVIDWLWSGDREVREETSFFFLVSLCVWMHAHTPISAKCKIHSHHKYVSYTIYVCENNHRNVNKSFIYICICVNMKRNLISYEAWLLKFFSFMANIIFYFSNEF